MWKYKGNEFKIEDYDDSVIGFVYLITNHLNNKKYIGKKILYNRKKRPPLKGKKRNRISQVESDWKTYFGSNDELKEAVNTHGEENFTREILHLCRNKSELSYLELKEQIDRKVLLDDNYYNGWISVKITGRGLDGLR